MHVARKRFGQHFLTDRHVISRIIGAIAPARDDLTVEIGPGLGALTRPLLDRLAHLHVVEIDRDIVARLKAEFPEDRLSVHGADALHFDFGRLGKSLRVVGNLPYNISTPLLFHLAGFSTSIRDCHFMLQKEVVARMVARPSTPEYGRLSVMLQYRFEMERLFTVAAGSFRPAPKVASAIVRMRPLGSRPEQAEDERLFSALVTAAFSQRRKTLRNALKAIMSAEDLLRAGVDPGLRGENLSVADFVGLANYLGHCACGGKTTPLSSE